MTVPIGSPDDAPATDSAPTHHLRHAAALLVKGAARAATSRTTAPTPRHTVPTTVPDPSGRTADPNKVLTLDSCKLASGASPAQAHASDSPT